LAGAGFSFFGFIHAGHLGPAGGEFEIGFGTGWRWAIGYLMCAAFFGAVALLEKRDGDALSM
ncbi:MAG: NCS2 family permease, partial [Deltaproteobacteria bacterium]|nr:NCS2 family permease [Deltaproteobacteria bacterium]